MTNIHWESGPLSDLFPNPRLVIGRARIPLGLLVGTWLLILALLIGVGTLVEVLFATYAGYAGITIWLGLTALVFILWAAVAFIGAWIRVIGRAL